MHALPPIIVSQNVSALAITFWPLFIAAMVWTIVLKGFALWYAAQGRQKWWFIALLLLNTVGILEIVYLIWFRPKAPPAQGSSAQA